MIVIVKPGDTMWKILQKINSSPDVPQFAKPVTIDYLLNYNIICNPNYIYPGQVFIIPAYGLPARDKDKAGAKPYYIVRPGDSLWCLSNQLAPLRPFSYPIQMFIRANKTKIQNPNLIYPGTELLISHSNISPEELFMFWKREAEKIDCDKEMNRLDYNYFYGGTFSWLTIGTKSIPYLLELLKLPCYVTRYFAAMALGRIAPNSQEVIDALKKLLDDNSTLEVYNQTVSDMAKIALKRIELVKKYSDRVHLTSVDIDLIDDSGDFIRDFRKKGTYPKGTPVIVLHWHIPQTTGGYAEGTSSENQLYDYIKILETGETGFVKRGFRNEIVLI